MKKLYIIIFFFPLLSIAQPTIQQSDEPVVNLYFATAIDGNYSAAIPAGGANQTWDYTNLLWADTGGGHFISAVGTPYESIFAPANLAVHDSVKNQWVYFQTSSSGFYTKGLDSSGVHVVFNPAWLYMPVPFTYTNTHFSTARAQIDTSFDTLSLTVPVKIVHTVHSYFDADGYGTLKLPTATFNNTLRVKVREVSYDTIYYYLGSWNIYGNPITSQMHYYRWFKTGSPDVYLLDIQADSLGTTATRSEYQVVSVISLPGVPEVNTNEQLTPYPNPTSNIILIDFDKPETGTVEVYNSIGKLVRIETFNSVNRYIMHADMLANGLFYFHVKTIDNRIRQGRFTVSR
jgi:hypothetical protein